MDLRQTPKTSRGKQRVQVDPPEGSRLELISPSWCDKTTWFANANEVIGGALSDSGDGLTFTSGNPNWIDTEHGKLTGEDGLDPKYKAKVYDNGVEQTPDAPFGAGGDGDYSIDYAAGTVTFHDAPTGPITADYYHANGSEWAIVPSSGKVIRLTAVEVQFSRDVVINDSIVFQAYGLVDVFAPQLLDTADPPGPYPSGTKIPLGAPTVYKTMMDYINEAVGSHVEIPAMGGASRGTSQAIQIFRWPYAERAVTELKSSAGMEVRLKLASETPFGGSYAIATFYGVSEDEG